MATANSDGNWRTELRLKTREVWVRERSQRQDNADVVSVAMGSRPPGVSHWRSRPQAQLGSGGSRDDDTAMGGQTQSALLSSQLHPAGVTHQPRPSHKPSLPQVGHAEKLTIRQTVDWYVGQHHKPSEGSADATETCRAIILLFLSHDQYVP